MLVSSFGCGLAAVVTVSVVASACGSSKSPARPDAAIDAAVADAPPPHYRYVANQVNEPISNAQATEWGLDLTGSGAVQNHFGMVLATLSNMDIPIQATTNAAVAEGSLILLVDLQAESFTNTGAAYLSVYQGSGSTPSACDGSSDTYTCTGSGASETCSGCAHQFGGSATFTLETNAPANPALVGPIANGTMTGGPGMLAVPLLIAGTTPTTLNLIGARVEVTGASAVALGDTTGVQPNQTSTAGVTLGGGIPAADIDGTIIPGLTTGLNNIVSQECTPDVAPPSCGCLAGSTAATVVGLFLPTGAPSCTLTMMDVEDNSLIESLLTPDIMIDGQQALSFGFNLTAVGAEFTPPS